MEHSQPCLVALHTKFWYAKLAVLYLACAFELMLSIGSWETFESIRRKGMLSVYAHVCTYKLSQLVGTDVSQYAQKDFLASA